MQLTLPPGQSEAIALYLTTAILVATVVTGWLKPILEQHVGLFNLTPANQQAHDNAIRGVNGLINLAALCALLAMNNQFDWHYGWAYIAAAFGQMILSGQVYQFTKTNAPNPTASTTPPGAGVNDAKTPIAGPAALPSSSPAALPAVPTATAG